MRGLIAGVANSLKVGSSVDPIFVVADGKPCDQARLVRVAGPRSCHRASAGDCGLSEDGRSARLKPPDVGNGLAASVRAIEPP